MDQCTQISTPACLIPYVTTRTPSSKSQTTTNHTQNSPISCSIKPNLFSILHFSLLPRISRGIAISESWSWFFFLVPCKTRIWNWQKKAKWVNIDVPNDFSPKMIVRSLMNGDQADDFWVLLYFYTFFVFLCMVFVTMKIFWRQSCEWCGGKSCIDDRLVLIKLPTPCSRTCLYIRFPARSPYYWWSFTEFDLQHFISDCQNALFAKGKKLELHRW